MKQNQSTDLRQNISDMIQRIDTMVSEINLVVGDIKLYVNDIDIITKRIEQRYTHKRHLEKPETVLDANGNLCDVIITPEKANQSNLTITSSYLDYTHLDISDFAKPSDEYIGQPNFTYNEKYPLWMQCDTWKTGNTASDVSVVSAGTESSHLIQSGSDGDTFNNSWNSVPNIGYQNNNKVGIGNNKESETNGMLILSKCCKSENTVHDQYCGVYEHIMEQQLDGIEPALHEELTIDNDIGDKNEWSDLSDDNISDCSLSLSDEHVIYYTKGENSKTCFQTSDITVTEISDSN